MECPKCGNILDENETSCKNCGAKIKENTLNSISKGGGKAQLPSPEEKAEVQREQIEKARIEAQKEAEAQAEIQDYIARQQLMAANKKNNMVLGIVVVMIAVTLIFGGILLHQKYSAKDSRAIKDNSNSATKQINGANGSNKQK